MVDVGQFLPAIEQKRQFAARVNHIRSAGQPSNPMKQYLGLLGLQSASVKLDAERPADRGQFGVVLKMVGFALEIGIASSRFAQKKAQRLEVRNMKPGLLDGAALLAVPCLEDAIAGLGLGVDGWSPSGLGERP